MVLAGTSIDEVLATTSRTLCGRTVARSLVQIGTDVTAIVGVNWESPDSGVGAASAALIQMQLATGKDRDDVFDDCDSWAYGGCGGPDCVNIFQQDDGDYVVVLGPEAP